MKYVLAIVSLCVGAAAAFTPSTNTAVSSTALYAATTLTEKTTLSDATTWEFRFSLKGLPTEKGKRVDEIFATKVHFIEEEGYEPPQGFVQQLATQQQDSEEGDENNGDARLFSIVQSRWQLSEDPTERKDGLWVWGLFKEPLYPFLLLQLETEKIPLAGEEEDSILPLKLFAQLTHQRDEDAGVLLSNSNDLKVRVVETMKADPFGAATVDVYEEVSIGNLQIQPIQSS